MRTWIDVIFLQISAFAIVVHMLGILLPEIPLKKRIEAVLDLAGAIGLIMLAFQLGGL